MNPVIELREKEGLSRPEMAARAGLSYVTLAHIEKGYPASMQARTAVKLSKVSRVKPAEMQERYSEWKRTQAV